MSLSNQAAAIAAEVSAACTDVQLVYDTLPARVETFTAVVSPAPQWGSFDGGTFCDAEVFWEVILVAALTDFAHSIDWFYARVKELANSDDLGVDTWSQPERISLGSSGEGLAVRVQLFPRTLEMESS